ncbi:DUF6300 family protein [Streptomyces sp. NPDC090442]|uniref:DUF6300 family protein n=1 Tax=Streptomyces sp. NPDC090442 TaxID=3365962 RepID=UPI003824E004
MTPDTGRPTTVTLRLPGSAPPPCPRCRAPVLLVARHPHSWHNRSGARVEGLRESVLCGDCDAGDPAAEGLLAVVSAVLAEAGDGADAPAAVASEALASGAFAAHLETWLTAVRHRAPDPAALAAEEARWRAGEL